MKSGIAYVLCPVCGNPTRHVVAMLGDEVVGNCRECHDTHLLTEPLAELLGANRPAQIPRR